MASFWFQCKAQECEVSEPVTMGEYEPTCIVCMYTIHEYEPTCSLAWVDKHWLRRTSSPQGESSPSWQQARPTRALLHSATVSPQTRPKLGHSHYDEVLAGCGLSGHWLQPCDSKGGGKEERQNGGKGPWRPLTLGAAGKLRHRPLLHPRREVQEQLDGADHRSCQSRDANRERVTLILTVSWSFRIPL